MRHLANLLGSIHLFEGASLLSFLERNPDVSHFLSLQSFTEKSSYTTITQRLQDKNAILNTKLALSISKLVHFCRVQKPIHVREFIGMIVDGWFLAVDKHEELSDVAQNFARAACPTAPSGQVEETAAAFMLGVSDGIGNIMKYSGKHRREIYRSRTA